MAQKRISKKVAKEITAYLKALKKDQLPIRRVLLFGSYAKGNPHRSSDIDLCIVSPQFTNAFDALQYLWSRRTKDTGLRIEPVGFHPNDFADRYDSLIQEIKRTGIEFSV